MAGLILTLDDCPLPTWCGCYLGKLLPLILLLSYCWWYDSWFYFLLWYNCGGSVRYYCHVLTWILGCWANAVFQLYLSLHWQITMLHYRICDAQFFFYTRGKEMPDNKKSSGRCQHQFYAMFLSDISIWIILYVICLNECCKALRLWTLQLHHLPSFLLPEDAKLNFCSSSKAGTCLSHMVRASQHLFVILKV